MIEPKVTIKANTSEPEAGLKRMKERMNELNKQLIQFRNNNDKLNYDKAEKELRKLISDIKQAEAAQRALNKAPLDLKTAPVRSLEQELKKVTIEWSKMTRGTEEWNATANRIKQVRAELQKTKDTLKESQSWLVRMNGKINHMVNTWGTSFVAAAAGATAFFMSLKKITDQSIKFEDTFAKTAGLLAERGQTPEQRQATLQPLETGALNLIKEYGFAIEEVNDALYETISAGVEASKSIEFMNTAAKLSVSGITSLDTAVRSLSGIINAYNMSFDEAETVAAKFYTAQKLGSLTVQELADNLGQVAPLAYNAGINLDELLAAMSAITLNGIKTSEAVTMLKAAIQGMIKPSTESIATLQKFNLPTSATQLQALGLGETLKRLSVAFATNADEITKAIPSVEGYMAIASLTGEKLQDFDKFLNQITTDIGKQSSMQLALEIQSQTTAAAIKKATGEITAMAIELGKALAPALKAIFQAMAALGNILLKVGTWLRQHATMVENLTKTIIVAATAVFSYKGALMLVEMWTKRAAAASLLQTVAEKASIVVKTTLRATSLLLVGSYQLLTGSITKATVSFKAFTTAIRANPIGLVVSLLTTAAAAYITFSDNADDAAKSQAKVNDELERFRQLQGANETLLQRSTQLLRMNKAQLAAFIDDVKQQFADLDNASIDVQGKISQNYNDEIRRRTDEYNKQIVGVTDQQKQLAYLALQYDLNQIAMRRDAALNAELDKTNAFDEQTKKRLQIALAEAQRLLLLQNDNVTGTQTDKKQIESDKLQALKNLTERIREYSNDIESLMLDATQKQVKAITDRYDQLIAQAADYANDDDAFAEAFQRRKIELEKLRDEEIRRVREQAHEQQMLQQQRNQEELEQRRIEIREKYGLANIEEQQQQEIALLKSHLEQQLITHEQFEMLKAQTTKKYADQRTETERKALDEQIKLYETYIDKLGEVFSIADQYADFFKTTELTRLDELQQAQQTQAEAATQRIEDQYARRQMSEEQYLNAKYKLQTDALQAEQEQANQRKQIEKQYALFEYISTMASIAMSTAKAVMEAVATFWVTGGQPWASVAVGMGVAQAALATAQYARVAGAEDGGEVTVQRRQDNKLFRAVTSNARGLITRPTLLVGEAGSEYVVPNDGVENPTLRPVLSIMEQARKSGTLRSINMNKAIRAVGMQSGGYTAIARNKNTTTANTDTELMHRILYQLANLEAKVVYTQFKEVEDNINEITNKAKITK